MDGLSAESLAEKMDEMMVRMTACLLAVSSVKKTDDPMVRMTEGLSAES